MQTLSIALPDFPVKSFAFFDLPQEVVWKSGIWWLWIWFLC